jgi:hypothetical protein
MAHVMFLRTNLYQKKERGNNMKKIFAQEFRLVRRKTIKEECYVMAMDWEHAERLGHEEEQEWEHVNSHDEIEAEEII